MEAIQIRKKIAFEIQQNADSVLAWLDALTAPETRQNAELWTWQTKQYYRQQMKAIYLYYAPERWEYDSYDFATFERITPPEIIKRARETFILFIIKNDIQ
jgi:hypothetical protein